MGMDCAISELCYKGTILQTSHRKMTIPWLRMIACIIPQ